MHFALPSTVGRNVPLLYLVYNIFFFLILVCEAIGTAATQSWRIVPASGDSEDDCGEADGM
jgi:hypothetical protein